MPSLSSGGACGYSRTRNGASRKGIRVQSCAALQLNEYARVLGSRFRVVLAQPIGNGAPVLPQGRRFSLCALIPDSQAKALRNGLNESSCIIDALRGQRGKQVSMCRQSQSVALTGLHIVLGLVDRLARPQYIED